VLCRIDAPDAAVGDGLEDKVPVGEGFQGCSALGDQDEERALQIKALQDRLGIIGIDIADELCIKQFDAGTCAPPFESEIERPGAQVAATDADLHHGGELFARGSKDCSTANLVGETLDLLQLSLVEGSLVLTVRGYGFPDLTATQMVEHQPILAGIHDLSIDQSLVLLGQ